MEHVINVKAIQKKMKHKPAGQRLWFFFRGVPDQLNEKELADMKSVLNKEHDKLIKVLDNYKTCKKAS